MQGQPFAPVSRRSTICALLTIGWFGAFRRSELVALTVADVKKEREGLVLARGYIRHERLFDDNAAVGLA